MEVIKSYLNKVLLLRYNKSFDSRGSFTKYFNKKTLKFNGVNFPIKESYSSVSKKGVIRGMHFDNLKKRSGKLIICTKGNITDVVLDVVKSSKTYGKFKSINISENDNKMIYVPSGFAHGFQSLTNNSELLYFSTKDYLPEDEKGFLWNSFGFDWPLKKCILSNRDLIHPNFSL